MEKVAFITGGSSGLGFETADRLGAQGYTLILLARNKDRLDRAAKILSDRGYPAVAYPCDITDEAGLRKIFTDVRQRFGKIDFLILNAGIVNCTLLSDFSDIADLKKDLDVDLWRTILATHIILPLLGEGSKILMISSGFGLMGAAGYSVYGAAKAGVINFAESLRRELLHKKISVHVACPGDMDTPQFHEEQKHLPPWMKKDAPRGMMHPRVAAEKILQKCRGNRLLIIINFEIKSMILVTRLVPRRLRDYLLDITFPRPGTK
jgi:short-subunit dehydrogenase